VRQTIVGGRRGGRPRGRAPRRPPAPGAGGGGRGRRHYIKRRGRVFLRQLLLCPFLRGLGDHGLQSMYLRPCRSQSSPRSR
jgi:hypothetical protein